MAAVVDAVRLRRTDALATLDLLQRYRTEVEGDRPALEHPKAVLEYLDVFINLVRQAADGCGRIADGLDTAPAAAHADALRKMADESVAEEPRCLAFRDKWLNRPLPHEHMRPLLNDISSATRDQLVACRDLAPLAAAVDALLASPPVPAGEQGIDRRQLLTRFFKR